MCAIRIRLILWLDLESFTIKYSDIFKGNKLFYLDLMVRIAQNMHSLTDSEEENGEKMQTIIQQGHL